MKTVLYILTTCAVVGLAFWAYRENYATQQALKDTEQLRREIRAAHGRLTMLRAEWAYLNRPDRLRELADLNFQRLGLMPLRPDQFGLVEQVSYPPRPLLPLINSIEVSSANAPEAQP
ncbi:cell division protein FtsL [Aliishimia ponticola]|uniref:Cell division protein FtsL n=1 Tax=Aliishimia ponticola TaxID=2499833 RepID=A0A4S4NHD7_9RHOB|nr:cell division protein FtsL [Aliishimia ponticola]THH39069.1 cell division protein FtsL [Aliishimia ponticola]